MCPTRVPTLFFSLAKLAFLVVNDPVLASRLITSKVRPPSLSIGRVRRTVRRVGARSLVPRRSTVALSDALLVCVPTRLEIIAKEGRWVSPLVAWALLSEEHSWIL